MADSGAVLIQQAKPGLPTPESLGEFVKAHRDQAYSIALRITHSASDAEDAVQDAALRFLSRQGELESLDGCQALFYKAVVQCALDLSRRDARRGQRQAAFCQMGSDTMKSQAPAGVLAERGETLQVLRQAVGELPEEERLPVALCFFEGLSVADTARSLDLPRETARARLRRAMEKLRGILRGKGHKAGAAVILGLLWRDGCQPASAALSAKLDSALPGRPCAQVQTISPPPQACVDGKEFESQARLIKPALATTAAVLLVSAAWLWHAPRIATGPQVDAHITPPHASAGPYSAGQEPTAAQPSRTLDAAAQEEKAAQSNPQEKPAVNAPAAAGKPASVRADEPQNDVAASVRQIEARKAEKAEVRSLGAPGEVRWQQTEIQVLGGPGTGERVVRAIKVVPEAGAKR